jgi:energy-coupling factor transporter ATP-binding protein EcfA2
MRIKLPKFSRKKKKEVHFHPDVSQIKANARRKYIAYRIKRAAEAKKNVVLYLTSPKIYLSTPPQFRLPELPASRHEPRKREIFIPLEGKVSSKLFIGKILTRLAGERRKGEPAEIDVSEPARMMIIGASGSGKSNLCKVIAEEYYKNTSYAIFIYDIESEYPLLALPNENPDILAPFDLEPMGFPVRVIAHPSVLSDEEYADRLSSLGVEKMQLRIDPSAINSDMLVLLSGSIQTKPYCDSIMNIYRSSEEKTLDALISAVRASAMSTSQKERMATALENMRPLFGPMDMRKIVGDRKINVFLFPSELFPSSPERMFWAIFFSSLLITSAYKYAGGLVAIMDEAAEFARGEHRAELVKANIGGLYRRGRKRRVDSVIATNVGSMLEDIKMNATVNFYLKIPETAISRSFESKGMLRKELYDVVSSLENYQAVMDLPYTNETYTIQIRPSQSYMPPRKKKEKEELIVIPPR